MLTWIYDLEAFSKVFDLVPHDLDLRQSGFFLVREILVDRGFDRMGTQRDPLNF